MKKALEAVGSIGDDAKNGYFEDFNLASRKLSVIEANLADEYEGTPKKGRKRTPSKPVTRPDRDEQLSMPSKDLLKKVGAIGDRAIGRKSS